MKKLTVMAFLSLFFLASPVFAQDAPQPQTPKYDFFKARVIKIIEEKTETIAGQKNFLQVVTVEITQGEEKGKKINLTHGGTFSLLEARKVKNGDEIVLLRTTTQGEESVYSISDKYRLDKIVFIAVAFFALVVFVAGRRGVGSLLGMGISLLVILGFIVPQILSGRDPLLISITGAFAIMSTTIYLAHGLSRKTTIAVGSTFISLLLTGVLSVAFVSLAKLSGLGDETAYSLQFGLNNINLKGLLLGGMIIGALGVLDDITTAQTTAVFEIAELDKKPASQGGQKFMSVFEKSFRIGREHITSLVNTLFLAYAGASLALFILFVLNPAGQPYWVIINSEVITEEIIRTLAGSMGLVLSVVITTALASYFATKKSNAKS